MISQLSDPRWRGFLPFTSCCFLLADGKVKSLSSSTQGNETCIFFFFKIGSGVAQAGFRLLILLPSVSSQVLSEWAGSLKSFSVDQCP